MIGLTHFKAFELAALVQTHLHKKKIQVVLSGGASVSYYTDNAYLSRDIDLINLYFTKPARIAETMKELGFQERGRHYKHPDTIFLVEFPPGPLAVGSEPVQEIIQQQLPSGILRIISPTDCIKDRLIAYYHWNDQQCLAQSVMVAQAQKIDIDEIERWSEVEGMQSKYHEIKGQLIKAQEELS